MTILKDIIEDYSPPASSIGVSLSSSITISFDRLMDEDSLGENFFISGPDTDQFVGPGVAEFNVYPDNVSQGDDFLASPGYQGIVAGAFSYATVSGKTVMTFTPSSPMVALLEYTAHLPEADDTSDTTYSGHITFSWTTGTGSIEALPDTASTSVLTSIVTSLSALDDLEIVKVTPLDQSIGNGTDLNRIEIEFNKVITLASILNNITVTTYPSTDHPATAIASYGTLAVKLSVDGKKVIIEI